MASGSFYSETGYNINIRLDYNAVANTNANTSTVTLNLYMVKPSGSYYFSNYNNTSYYNMTGINNTYKNWEFGRQDSEMFIGSSVFTVEHNSDGTGSTNVSAYWYTGISSSYMASAYSVSGTITLDTIERSPSTISLAYSGTRQIGNSNNYTITSQSSNFTHKVYYRVNNDSYLIDSGISGGTYSWTVPSHLIDYMTGSSTTVSVTVSCYTYTANGTLLGSTSATFTASQGSSTNYNPSATVSVTASSGGYVCPGGKITISTTSSINSGASSWSSRTISLRLNSTTGTVITSWSSTSATYNLNNLSSYMSGYTSRTFYITFAVTDSKNYTKTVNTNFTVTSATPPNTGTCSVWRGTNDSSQSAANPAGAYGRASMRYTCDIESTQNDVTVTAQIRKAGASSWTNMTPRARNHYDGYGNVNWYYSLSSLDSNYQNIQFEIKFTITDSRLGLTDTKTITLAGRYVMVDFFAGGGGIAFGQVATQNGFFCAMTANFSANIGAANIIASNNVSAVNVNTTNVSATRVNSTNFNGTRITVVNVFANYLDVNFNIATTNVSATRVNTTNISATNISATNISATRVTATNVNATNVNATRINSETVSQSFSSNGTEYATNMTVDGYTVYRRYVSGTTSSSGNFVTLVSSVRKLIEDHVYVYRSSDAQWHHTSWCMTGSDASHASPVFVQNNSVRLYIANGNYTNASYYGFIYYTKN